MSLIFFVENMSRTCKNEKHILEEKYLYMRNKRLSKRAIEICISMHECKIEEEERYKWPTRVYG